MPTVPVVGGRSRHDSPARSYARGIRNHRGEYDLWQRRFWEHVIRDNSDFARHVHYIHHNPVKHGLVANPSEWRWSSIHYYVRRGIIAPHCRGHQPDGRLAIDASRIALRFIQATVGICPEKRREDVFKADARSV
jgi:hypothetical protein